MPIMLIYTLQDRMLHENARFFDRKNRRKEEKKKKSQSPGHDIAVICALPAIELLSLLRTASPNARTMRSRDRKIMGEHTIPPPLLENLLPV